MSDQSRAAAAVKALAASLRVPHTDADTHHLVSISKRHPQTSEESALARRGFKAFVTQKAGGEQLQNAARNLYDNGSPREQAMMERMTALAGRIKDDRALMALVSPSSATGASPVRPVEAVPRRLQEDATSSPSAILRDIAAATAPKAGGVPIEESVMSPSTWNKLQELTTEQSTATAGAGAGAGASIRPSVHSARDANIESPSSFMAELGKLQLGRVPQRQQQQLQQQQQLLLHQGGSQSGPRSPLNVASNAANAATPGQSALYSRKSEDDASPVIIKFGQDLSFRSSNNQFLRADRRNDPALIGDEPSVFRVVNAAFREDNGPLKYGDLVLLECIGSPATKGTFLAAAADHSGVTCLSAALRGADRWTVVDTRRDGAPGTPSNVVSSASLYLRASTGRYLAVIDGNLQLDERADTRWHAVHWGTPFVPSWNSSRPYLTGEYIGNSRALEEAIRSLPSSSPARLKFEEQEPLPLNSYNTKLQEQFLIEDLLGVMLGFPGRYIRAADANFGKLLDQNDGGSPKEIFGLADELCKGADPSATFLARRILPASGYYARVSNYVESRSRYEYGLTVHALCSAMKLLLREYTILVAQLEHQFRRGKLSLQKLFFYSQPATRTLQALDALRRQAGHKKGGALLNILHELSRNGMGANVGIAVGDQRATAVYRYLLERAVVPTFNMLNVWLSRGEVDDPYDEFMIAVDGSRSRDDLTVNFNTKFWTGRYTLRHEQIPVFLGRASENILNAGKYLNVVRSCDQSFRLDLMDPGASKATGNVYYGSGGNERENMERVEHAYGLASKALMDLLLDDCQLVPRLKSLKHYFLVDQGDFFVHFMDSAEEELRLSVAEISAPRLESLLSLSIAQSTCSEDPFHDDLRCTLLPYTLVQHLELVQQLSDGGDEPRLLSYQTQMRQVKNQRLKGMEAFALDYKISWPLSLVVSRKELTKYQLIFRHLFFCNHVQRQLTRTWSSHQTLKELDLGISLRTSYNLRQRMLHFMQNLIYYMMVEVLEPRHHIFLANIRSKNCSTMDNLVYQHTDFLDTCLKECLLSNHQLLKLLTKIMTVCLLFAEQIEHFTEVNRVDELATDRVRRPRRHQSPGMEDPDISSAAAPTRAQRALRKKAEAEERARKSSSLQARRARLATQSDEIRSIVAREEYKRMIERFQDNFDSTLGQFMHKLTELSHSGGEYQSHINNLVQRLDYNMFYSEYLGLLK